MADLNRRVMMVKNIFTILAAVVIPAFFFAGCATTGCIEGNCTNGKGTRGCIEGNCTNGKGIYSYKDGDKYEGQWVNGKRDGEGIYTWETGKYYKGKFKNGDSHGWGIEVHPDGKKYEGEWINDKYLGKLIHSDKLKGLFSGKTVTIGEDGEKEYHAPDGTCYFDAKKGSFDNFAGGVVEGKWTVRNNQICYEYPSVSDKKYCHERFKKDGHIYTDSGKKLRLVSSDTENLVSALEKKVLQEQQAKQQAIEEEKKRKEKRNRQAKQAKKLVGKRVKWILDKDIESDNCILFGTICHSVTYRFRMIGVVSSVDLDEEQYRIKMSSIKLIPQEYVAPMYWKYKGRAQNWAAAQQGRYRMVEFEYVSPL